MQKTFLFSALLMLMACSHDTVRVAQQPSTFFKPVTNNITESGRRNISYQRFPSYVKGSGGAGNVNGRVVDRGFYEEALKFEIPLQLPSTRFPSWSDFQQYYTTIKADISSNMDEYCSFLLLSKYDMISLADVSEETKSVIFTHINNLVNKKNTGYVLLNACINWVKVNYSEGQAKEIAGKIKAYGHHILPAPNPELKDDPRIAQNPEFKAEMDGIIEMARENDRHFDLIAAYAN